MRLLGRILVCCAQAVAACLPGERVDWIDAMMAELCEAQSSRERVLWLMGTLRVALQLGVRHAATGVADCWPITVASGYLAAFSAYFFVHFAVELPLVRTPLAEAWFPLLAALCLTLVPAVIAFGLWTHDNFARRVAVVFCVLEMGMTLIIAQHLGFTPWRVVKIVVSAPALFLLLSPAVRAACSHGPSGVTPLGLSGGGHR